MIVCNLSQITQPSECLIDSTVFYTRLHFFFHVRTDPELNWIHNNPGSPKLWKLDRNNSWLKPRNIHNALIMVGGSLKSELLILFYVSKVQSNIRDSMMS